MLAALISLILTVCGDEFAPMGELALSSLPCGAVVWIDDHAFGVTSLDRPLRVMLAEGSHDVRFSRSGYADLHCSVSVKQGKRLPVMACLVPHWDQARPSGAEPSITAGQSLRGQFRLPGREPESARIKVREAKMTPMILRWSTPRVAISVKVVGSSGQNLGTSGDGTPGLVSFTVPDDGVAYVVVTCLAKDDPSWLGLGGYSLTLAVDACPRDDQGKRRAPKTTR